MSDKNKWFGFYSETAVKCGCPIATYKDKHGNEVKVTGVSPSRNGLGYVWSDKKFICELTGCKSTKSTYRPHPDFYRYWW